jgi:hypothetical protein
MRRPVFFISENNTPSGVLGAPERRALADVIDRTGSQRQRRQRRNKRWLKHIAPATNDG